MDRPSFNNHLLETRDDSDTRAVAYAFATGVAVGVVWYLCVAFRAGSM